MSSTAPSDPCGVTGQVCNWVHSVQLDTVPDAIKERIKHFILDGVACGMVGAHLPWSETAANTMFEFEEPGNCTIFGWDKKLGPLAAALLNSSFVQGFELDDWHADAPCHSESLILSPLFAAAEQSKRAGIACTGADFLLAAIVGFEIGPRTGLALYGSDLLARGFHSGTLMGHAGSAAACAKLLRLEPRIIEHSLGTACTQACGLMSAQFSSMAKRMQHGFAARNGLFAALMSRGGYTGIECVFECKYGGFLATFGGGSTRTPPYLPNKLVDELGTRWELERVRVKPYGAQAGLHTMLDCIKDLQTREPARMAKLDQLEKLHVEMGDVQYKHGCFPCPAPPLSTTTAQMCAPYAAAAMLLDGDVFVPQFASDKINRPVLWSLMKKISYEHNKAFDEPYILPSTTRVTVTFAGGEKMVSETTSAHGIGIPLTNEEIRTKYRKLMDLVVDPKRRDAIEALVLGMDKVEDVTKLTDLLWGTVKCAI